MIKEFNQEIVLDCAGLAGYRDTINWITVVYVPADAEPMREVYFCSACRDRLSAYATDGFVIADMYAEGEPLLFAVADGAEYEIRCYTVRVSGNTITVNGLL